MPALTGRYEHTLDDKHRLFAPSRYREQLAAEKGRSFLLARGADKCVSLFLPSQWESFVQKATAAASEQFKDKSERRDFLRELFSTAYEASPDEQGRILVPQHLKEWGGLEKEVVVLGAGEHAELWDKAALAKRQKSAGKNFERTIASLDL